jgi:hypothetical protein
MMTKQMAFDAAFILVLAAAPIFAHHSFAAEFDANKPVNLTGSVTKLEWMNPHAWFYIDVKDETGKVTNWAIEMGAPNGLLRAGWSRHSMKVGDVVTVEGSRAKDGTNNANARTVTLTSTGQKLFAASSQGQQ